MPHRWLVRFDIGGERHTRDLERAEGLGHATRSVAVIRQILDRAPGDALLAVRGDPDTADLLQRWDLPFTLDVDQESLLRRYRPDAVLLDVNHLDPAAVLRFRDTTKSPASLARELQVEALIEGSVQVDGNEVRVHVRLVQGSSATTLWAGKYTIDLSGSLAARARVVARITADVNRWLTASRIASGEMG